MRMKEYRIKKERDGTFMITPVAYGAKGRPVRLLQERVYSKDLETALERLAVSVRANKDRAG